MFTNIYAEGLAYAGQDSFEEVEITALFLEVSRSYGLYTSRAKIYAEDDDKSSSGDGFFKKIINFIRNLLKKIIDFFKKLMKKVVELVSRPFGVKLKAAEAAGGGGSSGSTTTRTSSSETPSTPENVIKGIEGNHMEINNVIKALFEYTKSCISSPTERATTYFSNVDIKRLGVEPLTDDKDHILATIPEVFQIYQLNQIYKLEDVNDIFNRIELGTAIINAAYEGIGTLYESKTFSDDLNLVSSIENNSIKYKVHPKFNMSIDGYIDSKSASSNMTLISKSFAGATRIMTGAFNSLEKCIEKMSSISSGNKNEKNKEIEYINAINAIITSKSEISLDDAVITNITQDNPFEIFGLPPKEAVSVYRYSILSSAGKDLIDIVGVDNINKAISRRSTMKFLGNVNTSKYNKMLDKDVIEKDTIKKLFKKVTIDNSGMIKKALSTLSFSAYDVDVSTKLFTDLASITDLDKKMNTENDDTKTSLVTDITTKASKIEAKDAVKSFLNSSASIVRNLSTSVLKFADVFKYTANTYESLANIPMVCAYSNLVYWTIDAISAHLFILEKLSHDPKFKEIYTTNDRQSQFTVKVNGIKAAIIETMKLSFGVQK